MMQKPIAAKTSMAISTKTGKMSHQVLCRSASVLARTRLMPTTR
jgi:hypothetical protein